MAKGNILVVDWRGDPDCMTCSLRDAGWFVDVEFEDGAQAYRLVLTEQPDAVVIDLGSRPSHGRELAVSLQNTVETRDIPLIFLDGAEQVRAQLGARIPHAVFTTWAGLEAMLDSLEQSRER